MLLGKYILALPSKRQGLFSLKKGSLPLITSTNSQIVDCILPVPVLCPFRIWAIEVFPPLFVRISLGINSGSELATQFGSGLIGYWLLPLLLETLSDP